MTDEGMALVELLQKRGDGDFLRAVASSRSSWRASHGSPSRRRLPGPAQVREILELAA
jgi:hypothetical protein